MERAVASHCDHVGASDRIPRDDLCSRYQRFRLFDDIHGIAAIDADSNGRISRKAH
jgi:hypothetical protein